MKHPVYRWNMYAYVYSHSENQIVVLVKHVVDNKTMFQFHAALYLNSLSHFHSLESGYHFLYHLQLFSSMFLLNEHSQDISYTVIYTKIIIHDISQTSTCVLKSICFS